MKNQLSTTYVLEHAAEIFHGLRWKNGVVVCPYCGSIHIKQYEGYKYKCNSCKNRFSDKTNTLMHGSRLPVKTWLHGIYEIMMNNLISDSELAIKLDICINSAWLLHKKIQHSLPQDRYILEGVVAHDEMHLGGCLSNMHYSKKWRLLREGHYIHGEETRYSKEALFSLNSDLKQPVFGINDGKNIVLIAIPEKKQEYLHQIYREHVRTGSVSVCDESRLYNDWEKHTGCTIHVNNHSKNQYKTEEGYSSNKIENTFSWFKRGFSARITHCKYYQLYLNEFVFRYNTRKMTTKERFNVAVEGTIGHHVTLKQIRQYNQFAKFYISKKKHAGDLSMDDIRSLFEWGCVESFIQNGRVYTKKDFDNGLF